MLPGIRKAGFEQFSGTLQAPLGNVAPELAVGSSSQGTPSMLTPAADIFSLGELAAYQAVDPSTILVYSSCMEDGFAGMRTKHRVILEPRPGCLKLQLHTMHLNVKV